MDEKIFSADTIDIKISDNDVVQMDFPEYAEEFPAIGEVKADTPFSVNKIEIYRRNTEIAKEEQEKAIAVERAETAAKRAEYEKMYREAEEMLRKAENMQNTAYHSSFIDVIDSIFNPDHIVDYNRSTAMGAVIAGIAAILLGFIIEYVISH